ncbi:hypothetical protein AZE42_03430 [Rhizopogon vesiculosus]|uniref:Uncharacterized protein n=1 Tax=Rhizopogon vesiculosus TaxID=180088 RepID=A0A1J8PSD2_9AGAM|nr:hypothetical protein AZE42_03430 [Rhizopogon vesiculosus]
MSRSQRVRDLIFRAANTMLTVPRPCPALRDATVMSRSQRRVRDLVFRAAGTMMTEPLLCPALREFAVRDPVFGALQTIVTEPLLCPTLRMCVMSSFDLLTVLTEPPLFPVVRLATAMFCIQLNVGDLVHRSAHHMLNDPRKYRSKQAISHPRHGHDLVPLQLGEGDGMVARTM